MNYYPHHIGDFRSGTVNMSRQARWIYRDMLDVYYDTEKPLPLDLDVLCGELGVESDDELKIVERLLRFKFTKSGDGYRHDRCDVEIAIYHTKAETAKANGKLGGRPKKANQNPEKPSGLPAGSNQVGIGNQDLTGSEANQEPRTNNQEPETTQQSAGAATAVQISIAMRKAGVNTQPADPRLIALAEQGVSVETVEAACAEAKKSKPNEAVGLGYVAKILERWASDAEKLKVAGASAPKKGAGAWWATDATVLAKGVELGMTPLAGEQMQTFKGRIQVAIDSEGKSSPPRLPPPAIVLAGEPVRMSVEAVEQGRAAIRVAAGLRDKTA